MKQVKVLLIKNECYVSDGYQICFPVISTLDDDWHKYIKSRFPKIKEVQVAINILRSFSNLALTQQDRNDIIRYEEYLDEFT